MRPREVKRLQKELEDIGTSKDASVSADLPDSTDLTHWKGTLKGPEGTPYEGGTFTIDIKIPGDYPYNPPKMKFDTKIWHPNISSQTGAICLDVLGKEWSPALTIRTALLSITAMLSAPEPDDPQDAEVADQYKKNRELFNQTAKYWTDTFAQASQHDDLQQKLKKLTDMGVDEGTARAALDKAGGDPTRAINELFG
jgi:ubiquitin-conjugating enzyme (huntingtin interacting protein 2)